MKNLLSFFILVFMFGSVAFGQGQRHFSTLLSDGYVPRDLLTMSSQDYNRAIASREAQADRRRTGRIKEDYLRKSSYQINRLLRSGIIVFNDPVTRYVREVADYILRNDPELRDELRFFTARHSAVNAFSTDAGIIIFTTGLLAQLDDEAQLAYVIAHEIIHYTERHGITGYVEEQLISQELENYDDWISYVGVNLASNNRSREMEMEADEKGFKDYFVHTEYDLRAALGVMDVLQYSYLPFNELEFQPDFLTNEYFSIPSEFQLERVQSISFGDDYDDSRSTHPSVTIRREALERMVSREKRGTQGKRYVVSRERFEEVKTLARYETIRRHVMGRDYQRALYDIYVMMQDYPDDLFLQEALAATLYGVALYKSHEKEDQVIKDHEEIEGESQQAYYLLETMSGPWVNTLALQYAWSVYQKQPDSRFLKEITDHLLINMVYKEGLRLDEYFEESKEALQARQDSTMEAMMEEEDETDEEEYASKYERLRERARESHLERDEEEYRFALVDLFNDPEFLDAYDQAREKAREKREDKALSYDDLRVLLKEEEEEKKNRHSGHRLGIDRMFILEPFFMSLDARQDDPVRYFDSEIRQRELSHNIRWVANQVNMYNVMLDPWALTRGEVEKYNDITLFKDWISEFFEHDKMVIIPFSSRDIYPIMEDHDVRYLKWTGVAGARVRSPERFMNSCGLLLVGLAPFVIHELVTPKYEMMIFSIIIDLEEANIAYTYRQEADRKATETRVKHRLYDLLNQVATRP